jgi:predicted membrane-bound spermidine synthase
MPSAQRRWIVLTLFFCSGAAALVYEVIWSKFLSQILGSTVYAQTLVLAAFMGGLAIGNSWFGRRADRWQNPLRAYGALEVVIGAYAFFYNVWDRLADGIFIRIGSGIAGYPAWLLVLKAVLSALLLLGPTILMGGTLPLLAAWLQKSFPEAGRGSALFYAVNSLGAVAGAGMAGFWLVSSFGMVEALRIATVTNLAIGAAAILLGRANVAPVPADNQRRKAKPEAIPLLLRPRLIVAATGAISMGLEVLASRSMALIFGSSLQSFAIVLMAFILGIGLGSAWIAAPRRRVESAGNKAMALLCVASGWVTLLVLKIELWTDVYRMARAHLAHTGTGYVLYELLAGGISIVVLGVPAACIGGVLPLMIRSLSGKDLPLGKEVGTLLAWNTVGAVAGTLLTGFVLMPTAGLRTAFGLLALALGLVALMAASDRFRLRTAIPALSVSVLACAVFVLNEDGWRQVMSAGVFRLDSSEFDPTLMAKRKQHTRLLFYKDAPDATVSVEQGDERGAASPINLRINGKADASTGIDIATQLLLAHLPMLAKPDAHDVFVLGLGSGITAGATLNYPLDHLVVAENCPPVLDAARCFTNWNQGLLNDRRARIRVEDARTVLKLEPQLYDVIITEPSNPWSVGVGSVFSLEFYQLAASRLKPGGVVAQWFHIYEMQDDLLKVVLRTFGTVFPYTEVWDTGPGDIVLLGSQQPWPTGSEVFSKGFEIARVRANLKYIGISSPRALLARQVASQRTAFAIAGDGPLQTDLHPILEYSAPRAFYIGAFARLLDGYDERRSQQLLAPAEKQAALRSLTSEDLKEVFANVRSINRDLLSCVLNGPGESCIVSAPDPPGAPASTGVIDRAITALNTGDVSTARQISAAAVKQNPVDEQVAYVNRIIQREVRMLEH